MTTHVFIVDDVTFKCHLEYMFAGTGAKEKTIDFNNSNTTNLYHSTEDGLVAMMADCSRVRKGDYVIFYLLQGKLNGRFHEGRFYGIFKIDSEPFLDSQGKYLKDKLCKTLTFRVKIKPFEVYAKGVTEWQALDEIKNITSPCQMLWSLIYRKLKGNRGNTMITLYEASRLFNLLRLENNNQPITNANSYGFNFDTFEIEIGSDGANYKGAIHPFNIQPRLISKYGALKSHEAHLQMYITQNLGTNKNASLDSALDAEGDIEWLGNEVSCGVGMQRIDVMFSKKVDDTKSILVPIELKAVFPTENTVNQLRRYVDWIEQYYIPNKPSVIQPVLLCKTVNPLPDCIKRSFHNFNADYRNRCKQLKYIEYYVDNDKIVFKQVDYLDV